MRITSVSRVAMGSAALALAFSAAHATVAQIQYPIDTDGAQTANVARRYNVTGQLITLAGNGGLTNLANQENGPGAAIDGAGTFWNLSGANNDSAASVKLDITLDQVYTLKKFANTFAQF